MNTSRRAAKALNEKLTGMFYAEDIGFRVMKNSDGPDKDITIMLDKKSHGDEVIETSGIKLFLDPEVAVSLKNCELDYRATPEAGFLIKRCRSKVHQNPNATIQ